MTRADSLIDSTTLRSWLEQGRAVTLLDVRPHAEREEWAIPGSIHVDVYDRLKAGDIAALADVTLPTDVPVVTICAAGKTSLIAAEQLRSRGIPAVSLDGGMRAWSLAWNTAEIVIPDSTARVIQVRRTGKGCLSYVIGVGDVAVVIDPALDPAMYLSLAEQSGWRIAYVLETHLHADHLSRARALADLSGAALMLPAGHRMMAPFTSLDDGAMLTLGAARLTVLQTPGHTPESVTYLLDNRAIFTGDTLFLAAVGRPDLHADAAGARAKAHALYQSLQRLLALPPETLVLPGHTSAPVAFNHVPIVATLAEVRQATTLLVIDEDAFVTSILGRIPPTPPNHAQIIALNEHGAELPADPTELEAGANRCAIA
ncbi:MAG TPA: MBL fold metallo-hydrolase [Roseiflexaceae bacterium]|nr:MBL fold metallo-hydrolase [Roseiflexaceae bacterium]